MHIDYCRNTAETMTQFAQVMVGQMKSREMMQKQLAYEIGWKPSRVSKVLRGNGLNLTIDTMLRLCEALGLRMVISYEPREKITSL